MPTTSEAAAALEAVRETRARSLLVEAYAQQSFYLILWGVIWLLANGVAFFVSRGTAGRLWLWLGIGGALLSWGYATVRQSKVAVIAPAPQRRIGLFISFAFLAYWFLWLFLLKPLRYEQVTTFATTVFMFAYVVAGIAGARFFLWLGLSITALAFANYLYGGPYFDLVLAGLGGFGLIGGGIYLSRWRQ
jgi:hypothetical protein